MSTAHDVAKYILEKTGPISAMKFQKLVYYSQAWSLVWDERPMFAEKIQAWANGPVVPSLYEFHRGEFQVASWQRGDVSKLDPDARETIDAVLKHYGSKTAQALSDLTHREDPWRNARKGLPDGERGSVEIKQADMEEFYSSL